MLKTDREKKICEKYGARDEQGYVHCGECPLLVHSWQSACACKATAHYNRKTKEWEMD